MKKFSLFKYVILSLAFRGLTSYGPAQAQAPLTSLNTPYTQDFNTLATSGTSGLLPNGWHLLETGTNADTLYVAGTGSSNAGNTYSFGEASVTDRALGSVLSGSLASTLGALFENNTGTQITQLQITYAGEQWRSGVNTGRRDSLIFEYSLNATSLSTGSWNRVSALDFASLSNTVAGTLNGNDPANRSNVTATIQGLSIAAGASFWLRWSDYNAAGADDGLAIDDFSLTPSGEVMASLTFAPASLNFGNVNPTESRTLSYTVTGNNLSADIELSTSGPYTLSTDSLLFTTSVSLPATGGQVFVRFAPTALGLFANTIVHISGDLQQNYSITGTGFDQVSSIIPIAQARSQEVGTSVTVAGRITVANQFGGPSYLQDATGGIPVFSFPLSTSVTIGDSVIVSGPIGVFNEQKQISGNGITFTKVETASRIPVPQVIALSELAAYEGQLVTVENAEFVNKSFVLLPDNNQDITSDGTTAQLRVDGDTDLPGLLKPQLPTAITGVVGRFRTTAQLLPRFREDIPGVKEPDTQSDSLSKDQTFDVVTWNVEWFNSPTEGPTNDPLQFENVRKIIQRLDADVYAFEEIANDSAFVALTAQLPGYRSFCSDTYSYSFDPTGVGAQYQKICFLYKTATVDSVSTKVLLKELYEDVRSGNTSGLPSYPGDPQSFWASGRLPYLFEFNATIGGQTKRIHLVDIHARANSGTNVTRYDRRKYDVELLKDTLDAQYGSDNVILVGDYNDDVEVSVVNNLPSSFEKYVQDTINYQVLTLPLSEQGYFSYIPSGSFLDHITISDELKSSYLENSIRIETPFDLVRNYVTTTSDHLPVSARFQFIAPCTDSVSIVALPSKICQHATPITLVGMPQGGSFTIDGAPATIFDPASANTESLVVYTYTNAQTGCTYSSSQVVFVNPAPNAAARLEQAENERPDVTSQLVAAPNPFSHQTTLTFSVAQSDRVSLDLYNAQGKLVQKLFEGQAEAGQVYHFDVDAHRLDQSLYISRLVTSTGVKTVKLVVMK